MVTKVGDRLDEAIVLCGGLGTRLHDIAGDRPKALVEVCGRPFLEWLLLALIHRHDIRRVILATGHLGDTIEGHFGKLWCGARILYSREPQPLGTAGAVRLAASQMESPHVLVLNGDSFCSFDSPRLLDVHIRKRAVATLWLTLVTDGNRFGNVVIDSQGRIAKFEEKALAAGRQLASAGVYLIEQDAISTIASGERASLERDVFPSLVGRGLFGIEGSIVFTDIGTPESLRSADDTLESELEGLDCD